MDFMGDMDRDRGDFDMGMGMLEGGRMGQMDRGEGMVDLGDGRRDQGISDMMRGDFIGGIADQGLGRMQRDRGRQDQMRGMDMGGMGMGGMGMGMQQDRMLNRDIMMNQERQIIDQGITGRAMMNQMRIDNQFNEQRVLRNQMDYGMNQGYQNEQLAIQEARIDYNQFPQQRVVIEERPVNNNFMKTEVIEERSVYNNCERTEVIQQRSRPVYSDYKRTEIIEETPVYSNFGQTEIVEQKVSYNSYNQKEVIYQKEVMSKNSYSQGLLGTQINQRPVENKLTMMANETELLHPARFESAISIHKIFEWKLQFARLNVEVLQLPNKKIAVREITKIKCLTDEGFQKHRQIKIQHNMVQDVFFAAQVEREQLGLPLQYAWFAKIINAKLCHLGYDLEKPFVAEPSTFNMGLEGAYCKGLILKRSQFLKKWQTRFIIITPEGLFSYKNPNEPFSFSFKAIAMKYVWSRFDIQNRCLVIKIMHGMEKTEFAIPIMNYCIKSEHNWLWAFYRLLMERNIMHQLK